MVQGDVLRGVTVGVAVWQLGADPKAPQGCRWLEHEIIRRAQEEVMLADRLVGRQDRGLS
jgi:hypothetical protein